jgi:hypothetical protein
MDYFAADGTWNSAVGPYRHWDDVRIHFVERDSHAVVVVVAAAVEACREVDLACTMRVVGL